MKVETFECQETMTEPIECCEEAAKIIEEMGLIGQQELIQKQNEKPVSRCPYREIKADERFVYGQLCPERVELKNYQASPIPLRVLQIIAHAKSLEMFAAFQVWCAKGVIKDPVLVAYKDNETWRASNIPFILARWGEELDEWTLLVPKALKIWKEKAVSEIKKIKAKISQDLATIEQDGINLDDVIKKEIPSYFGW